ncbi:MAG: aminomethyl-transferring glycine dehydrogenase subunit GcvPA [bacterium]
MSYVPHTDGDKRSMLAEIGISSVEELFADLPPEIEIASLNLPEPLSEPDLIRHIWDLGSKNIDPSEFVCFAGAGAYDHFIPAVVDELAGRSEFYTSYTPYQAEMSQGMLQSIYEYQTMICDLTGMDASNASMYDGGSALAEAALMACRATKKRSKIVASETVNPRYLRILRTYIQNSDVELITIPPKGGSTDFDGTLEALDGDTAAVVLQNPNYFGVIEDVRLADAVHANGSLLIVSVNPISLGILKSPGECGADIVVGEGQPLGNPLNFGGPYLGFFASKMDFIRQMPGRIVGATVDGRGRRGFVLTLQAREQHIRRGRATSNICTNEALVALRATIYLAAMGREGFRRLAELNFQKAHYAADRLGRARRFSLKWGEPFFNEFALRTPVDSREVIRRLLGRKIIAGVGIDEDTLLVAVTEKRTRAEIDAFASALEEEYG